MTLIDAPGMSWREMEQDTAAKLAATYSIGRAAYDDEEVALSLGNTLLRRYPELLAARFGAFRRPCDEHGLLAFIATPGPSAPCRISTPSPRTMMRFTSVAHCRWGRVRPGTCRCWPRR